MKKFVLFGLVSSFLPVAAFAAADLGDVLAKLIGYLNYIVPALITVAVVYFVWGVISFIISSEEEAKKKGKTKIINGLIGLFVIVSFWGIIAIVQRSLEVNPYPSGDIVPDVPTRINN